MARRRRANPTPLDRLKSAIRGSTNGLGALYQLRGTAPISVVEQLAAWSLRTLSLTGPLRNLRPRSLRELQEGTYFPPLDLHREIEWLCGLFKSNSARIENFVQKRDAIQSAALSGNAGSAVEILDALELKEGYSMWSIATRIGLLQAFYGIEAQKEWVAQLRERGAVHEVMFFAFWWSVRAEDDTSPERFVSQQEKRIRRWDLNEVSIAHLDYQLRHVFPKEGSEIHLIAQTSAISLIDLYSVTLDLASHAVATEGAGALAFGEMAQRLIPIISDFRLPKLAFLAGDPIAINFIPSSNLDVRDLLVSELSTTPLASVAPELEEICAAVMLGKGPLPFSGPLWERARTALRDTLVPGTPGNRARSDLVRIGLLLDRIPIGEWCLAMAEEAAGSALMPSRKSAFRRFIASPGLHPLVLPHLPARLRDAMDARLRLVHGGGRTSHAAGLVLAALPTDDLRLGPGFLAQARIRIAYARDDFRSVVDESRVYLQAHGATGKWVVEAHILATARSGDLRGAVSGAVAHFLDRPELVTWLPLGDLAALIAANAEEHASLADMAELPIFFDLLAKNLTPDYQPRISYACEDFLETLGVERPSDIDFSLFPGGPRTLLHFLREICVLPVLRLSTAYGTERELEDERIRICGLLSQLDKDSSDRYSDEARALVRGRLVKHALRELQRSKVSIDADALRAWAEREIREDYDRYCTLLASGVAVVDAAYRNELLRALETGQFPKSLFEVPENEASALFARLFSRFIHECAFNSEHGFDCYLSLRVRHGTLSGLLRGPVDHERLVTRRDAASGEYKTNEHWLFLLAEYLDTSALAAIDDRLRNFSRDYDTVITRVTENMIQVRREEKPTGLFQLHVPTISIFGLATEISADTPFPDFLDKASDVFWSLVDASLSKVRLYVETELREEIRKLFDHLEGDISNLGDVVPAGMVGDAIRRARNEVGLALDRMQDWFVLPTSTSSIPFTLEELVDVGLATIKSFYRDFEPQLQVKADDVPPLTGALILFSDIFFVLFENIHEHSDMVRPGVIVTATAEAGILRVQVRSEVYSPSRHRDRIHDAKDRIATGAYKSAVRREGGTGLPKLAKLLKADGRETLLEFGLDDEERHFVVEFELPVALIADMEEIN